MHRHHMLVPHALKILNFSHLAKEFDNVVCGGKNQKQQISTQQPHATLRTMSLLSRPKYFFTAYMLKKWNEELVNAGGNSMLPRRWQHVHNVVLFFLTRMLLGKRVRVWAVPLTVDHKSDQSFTRKKSQKLCFAMGQENNELELVFANGQRDRGLVLAIDCVPYHQLLLVRRVNSFERHANKSNRRWRLRTTNTIWFIAWYTSCQLKKDPLIATRDEDDDVELLQMNGVLTNSSLRQHLWPVMT
jgi:hypothetical protein